MTTIYYLTGRGGRLDTGVGQGLLDRGLDIVGREMSGDFDLLSISEQVGLIRRDLQTGFWSHQSRVLAVSYGAYLLMQTLSELEPYPGSILLLSPVLGGVCSEEKMRYFSPPRAGKLMSLIDESAFPAPRRLEIHVGDNDWQSPYERAEVFADSLGGKCFTVANTGHDLGVNYVSPVLDLWLNNQCKTTNPDIAR